MRFSVGDEAEVWLSAKEYSQNILDLWNGGVFRITNASGTLYIGDMVSGKMLMKDAIWYEKDLRPIDIGSSIPEDWS